MEEKPLQMQIARVLFWINLIPTVVAVIALILISLGGYLFVTPIVMGIFCEGVYYLQSVNSGFAKRKIGWIYSILVNLLFITVYISQIFFSETQAGMSIKILSCYPLFFLIASIIALIDSFQIGNTTEGFVETEGFGTNIN